MFQEEIKAIHMEHKWIPVSDTTVKAVELLEGKKVRLKKTMDSVKLFVCFDKSWLFHMTKVPDV